MFGNIEHNKNFVLELRTHRMCHTSLREMNYIYQIYDLNPTILQGGERIFTEYIILTK